jgi:hypothetical protein
MTEKEKKTQEPKRGWYNGKLRRVSEEELERIKKYSQNAVQISIRPRRVRKERRDG